MSIDDLERERRAEMRTKWAKARAQAKARTAPAYAPVFDIVQSRRQVAIRAQRAASEALAELRRQRQAGQS